MGGWRDNLAGLFARSIPDGGGLTIRGHCLGFACICFAEQAGAVIFPTPPPHLKGFKHHGKFHVRIAQGSRRWQAS